MSSGIQKQQSGWVVMLLAGVCTFLWGSAFSVIKIGYECFGITQGSPFDKIIFAGYRFTLSGILTIIFMSICVKKAAIPKKKNWLRIFLLGIIQTAVHYLFFYLGLGNTTGAKSAILTGSATFFLVIFGAIFTKNDPITLRKAVGCVLGFIGVALINWSFDGTPVSLTLTGDGFMIIAAIVFAIGNIMSKFIGRDEDSRTIAGWQLFFGGAALIITGLAGGGKINRITGKGVLVFIYLVLLSIVAYSVWTYLLTNNPVSRVSIYFFLNPAFGVLLSGVILHEDVFNIKNMISLAIVCVGIIIVNAPTMRSEKTEPSSL